MEPYTTKADSSGDCADVEEAVEPGPLRLRHNTPKDGVDDDRISGSGVANPVAGEEDEALVSVERAFEGTAVPTWREQLTVRAFVVSFFLAVWFSIIMLKFYLTTGIVPSFNISAGAVGYFFVRLWTGSIERVGFLKRPFTRQENTIIQTCVVSANSIVFSGGFGSYLLGMSEIIAKQDPDTNTPENVKDPQIVWMIGFLFLVSFVGLFALVPLAKIMIVDYKLTYPSGMASAYLINGFHTPHGANLAKKQVKTLGKFFSFSVLWGLFQWFYTAGNGCGFRSFPTFGLEAYNNSFHFDFSPTFVGIGMICPHIVNVSVLLGGILSWGLMWPLIHTERGSWFSAELGDRSLHGLQGYRVFISIALILGDGLYHFLRVLYRTTSTFIKMAKKTSPIPGLEEGSAMATHEAVSFDEQRRTEFFLKDQIPKPVAFAGYAAIAVVSIATLPQIFPELKWYYILLMYVFAPMLAFCNAYGVGLTNWSLASSHGKLAIFIFGAWAGASHGGVLVGLAACGVMMSIVSMPADLMGNFKTGYLTLASPKSMFVSQLIGTAMGCVIAPCIFWLFYKSIDIGKDGSEYQAPYATIYRSMAILGVEGFSKLPKNCLTLCFIFFAVAIKINLIRDLVPSKIAKFIPLPMAMAIPFHVGSYFTIDMFVGTVIIFVWSKRNKAKAEAFGPAVAAGLICGDASRLPQSILALANVKPPICMKFLSRAANARVDAFLGN